MFDSVNFWINRGYSGEKTFDVIPFLSEITERKSKKYGYSCTGKLKNYTVSVFENGISLKGSLAKNYYGDNLHTLTRRDTEQAIECLSDDLHLNLKTAKITRLDVSTIIQTKYPPAEYYGCLGNKPYFERLQSTPETLYYNNYKRQLIFYNKTKEANAKDVPIPEILQNSNLLRYELRYTKRLNKQLNTVLMAEKLYNAEFYRSAIKNWENEFKTIQKQKKQTFMTNNIKTTKEAETALFASLLQEKGQEYINDYLAQLKAENVFKERQRYSELKRKLNTIIQSPNGEQNDLMQELEKQIFDIARYAR